MPTLESQFAVVLPPQYARLSHNVLLPVFSTVELSRPSTMPKPVAPC